MMRGTETGDDTLRMRDGNTEAEDETAEETNRQNRQQISRTGRDTQMMRARDSERQEKPQRQTRKEELDQILEMRNEICDSESA